MSEDYLNPDEEAQATPDEGSETEESSELEDLFSEAEGKETVSREEFDALKKGVSKFFSERGRKEKATNKAPEPKGTPNHASDDVTELFLESKPEAELVKNELKMIADKLYNGSILKAWKEETWLHAKAQALSESNAKKSKISSPSNQIEGEFDLKSIEKMDEDSKALAISKMTDKEYSKWKEYRSKQGGSPGMIRL